MLILKYWKYIVVLIFGIVLGSYLFPQAVTKYVQSEPIVLPGETKTVTETVLIPVQKEGDIVQFINKGNKIVAVINGQEYDVPNQTGNSQIKLGENGQLQISQQTQGTLDITPVFTQLLQSELEKERMKWEKKQKHFGVGVIISNKGFAPKVSYDNANYKLGAFYTPNFHGGELGWRF